METNAASWVETMQNGVAPDEGAASTSVNQLPTNVVGADQTVNQLPAEEMPQRGEFVSEFKWGDTGAHVSEFVFIPTKVDNESVKKSRGIIEAIKASATGKDPYEAYREGYINPAMDVVKNIGENVATTAKRLLSTIGIDQGDALVAKKVTEEIKDTQKRSTDANLGPYYAFVDSLPVAAELTKEDRDNAAFYLWNNNQQAAIWDSMTKWGVVKDLLTTAAVADGNYRMKNLADYVGMDYGAADAADYTNFLGRFFAKMSEMPVKQRAVFMKDIVDKWESFGIWKSKMDAMTFLGQSLSFDNDERAISHISNTLDRVDQVGLAAAIPKLVTAPARLFKGVVKATSLVRQMGRLGDVEGARMAAKAAAQGLLKEANVSPLDGANTLIPVERLAHLTQGADPSMAPRILELDTQLKKLTEDFDPMALPLTETDKLARIDKAIAEAHLDPNVHSVQVMEQTDKGFKLNISSTSAPDTIKPIEFTLNDVGSWELADQKVYGGVATSLTNWLWTRNFKLPSVRKDLMQIPYLGQLQAGKLKDAVDYHLRQGLKGIKGKDDFAKVNELLLVGDDNRKVFSYTEAVDVGIGGRKYTPAQYEAYLSTNRIMDALYVLQDKKVRGDMIAKGIKRVQVNGVEGFGRVYNEYGDANTAYRVSDSHSRWFTKDGKVIQSPLSPEELQDAYENGYRLVRNHGNDFFEVAGQTVEWALVKGDEVADIVGPVLNKIPGYITRIGNETNFFLKRKIKRNIGGKEVEMEVTERSASTYDELDKFMKNFPDTEGLVIRADRELSRSVLEDDQIRSMGGLFTGHRKQEPIPHGIGPDDLGSRKTALESLQAYMNNVADNMPMSVYRMGMREKWINSAMEAGAITDSARNLDWNSLKGALKPDHPSTPFFREAFDAVSLTSKIPTREDAWWAAQAVRLGKAFEKAPFFGKSLAKGLYENKSMGVLNKAKAFTYHMTLGLGNMSQVAIQGSGALVAMSINPVHGVKGFGHALEFALLDSLRAGADIRHLADKVDLNAYKLWDKSGFRETILSANLDYASAFTDLPYDAGLLRRVFSKSDFFLQAGEMAYSRTAFGTAYDYMKKQLGRTPTEADLPAIIARADDYRMNMHKQNTAKFQHGIMSLPTQFMQVQTKFVEKILGKDLTAAEKLRLGGMQIALYGSLGIPFFGSMTAPVLDFLGINSKELSAEELEVVQRGVIGWALNTQFGLNIDFSSRVALSSSMAEDLLGLWYGETNMRDLVGGPAFSTLERMGNVVEKGIAITKFAFHADDMKDSTLLAAAKVFGQELAEMPSSTRNLIRAYTMANSKMYMDKQGKHVFQYRNTEFQNVLAQSMGFQSMDVQDFYDLKGATDFFSDKKTQSNYAKAMAGLMTKMLNAGADQQDVYAAAYNMMTSAMVGQRGGEKVLKQVYNALKDQTTPWGEHYYKAMKMYEAEWVDGFSALMSRSKIRTNVSLAQELEKRGMGAK